MKTNLLRTIIALNAFAILCISGIAKADFLDITSLTPGTSGSFTGTIEGVAVMGSITTTTPGFQFDAPGPTYFDSTIDNSSPQFSYGSIFTPSTALTDRIGYTSFDGTFNPATITINFASPITNPVFHVANLDAMQYDFTPTIGLGSLVLLSGNGDVSDGLRVSGNIIFDANNGTVIGQTPSESPFTTGDRSAYGSISLLGTFTTLTFDVSNGGLGGDGGAFTLSTAAVPEPGSVALLAGMATVCAGVLYKRRKR